MKYYLEISEEALNYLKVRIEVENRFKKDPIFFCPLWAPGYYKKLDFPRFVRKLKASTQTGEALYFKFLRPGQWQIDWEKSELQRSCEVITLEYEYYAHSDKSFYSFIDESRATLNLASCLMGFEEKQSDQCEVEIRFPALWSKLSTSLEDISPKRELFLYKAQNYHELLDSPIFLGCHETDGFMANGVPHEIGFGGDFQRDVSRTKNDLRKVFSYLGDLFQFMPFNKYTFLTVCRPGPFDGLEHFSSALVYFEGTRMKEASGYHDYLVLCSHEYFHAWFGKYLRPSQWRPYDYQGENSTELVWLVEGLTSFVDEWSLYACELIGEKEFSQRWIRKVNDYLQNPGRLFESLEESCLQFSLRVGNWNENDNNQTVHPYTKGSLLFLWLYSHLIENRISFNLFLKELFEEFKANQLLEKERLISFIEKKISSEVAANFQGHLEIPGDFDFDAIFSRLNWQVFWKREVNGWLGFHYSFSKERVRVQQVYLDGPAYKAGLMPGDIFQEVNGQPVLGKAQAINIMGQQFLPGDQIRLKVSRQGRLLDFLLIAEQSPRLIRDLSPLTP